MNMVTDINEETFAFLSNGMSIDEVQGIIGVPPTTETTTEMLGITTTIIMWMDGISSISVTFTDGHVISTLQMGL